MAKNQEVSLKASPEQVRYAGILEKGMYVGLATLFITFAIYAFGIMDPYIPLDKVSHYWSLSVHDYLHEANIGSGWSWAGMLNRADFLNFIGIAFLAGTTIICYLAIIPILLKNNDKIYAVLAILEVVILSLAASGLLAVGH